MNPTPDPSNGWGEWSRYVLHELERLNESSDRQERRLTDIESDIKVLKEVQSIKATQQEKQDSTAKEERSWLRDHMWELFLTGIMILNMVLQFKP